jgi:hypothetical protein
MRDALDRKRFSENTGKLHISCPHRDKTGVDVHVVIKGGWCYRSGQCMAFECKYNRVQSDIESLLSIMW